MFVKEQEERHILKLYIFGQKSILTSVEASSLNPPVLSYTLYDLSVLTDFLCIFLYMCFLQIIPAAIC